MSPTQIEALSHDLAYKILAPPEIAAIIAKHAGGSGVDDDEQPQPDSCAECDQVAVGYDEGTPFCAEHYRRRPPHPSIAQHADQPTK